MAMTTSTVRKATKRDWKERIRELRALLSADPKKPMTQERFSQLVGVAGGTVARWESTGKVDPWMARKLERLERTLSVLSDMIVREDRVRFLEQAHPLLVGLRPIDLLDNENGCAKVVQLLEGMESGDFA
jgi:uncharacterized protein (DUF2384 family)